MRAASSPPPTTRRLAPIRLPSRRRRRLAWGFGIAAALLAALAVAAWMLLPYFVRKIALRRLEERLGVAIDAAEVDAGFGRIDLGGVRVRTRGTGIPLAAVAKLSLDLDGWGLLRGRVGVERIVVRGPSVSVAQRIPSTIASVPVGSRTSLTVLPERARIQDMMTRCGRPRWCMLALTAGLAPGCYSSGGDDEDAGRDGDALADGDAPVDFAETPGDVPAEGDTRAGPWPVLFRLRFVSDIPESVWVAEWVPPYPAGHWLTIHRGGVALAKEPACDVCNCDACPGCSLCGEPCKNGTELPNGGSVEYLWSGVEYPQVVCPTDPSAVCQQPATSGPVGPYSAQFCWGTVMTGSGCAVIVGDLECADVPFTLPDPDGLVEYTIDRGG